MCRYCHIEGNNPYAIKHLTINCQDSRNPYKNKELIYKPPMYNEQMNQHSRQQMQYQQALPQPWMGWD